jgi:hypothetical protein
MDKVSHRRVASRRMSTSIAINDEERGLVEQLVELKYKDLGMGISTVIRLELIERVKEELARIASNQPRRMTA